MYTQCPQCLTIFEIDEEALQASLGIVRCGHCAERFDALRTLSDTLPSAPGATLPEHEPDVVAPTLTAAVSPEDVQAAARPPHKRTSEPVPTGGESTGQVDEAWGDALSTDRARALIADAAGIPPEAVQDDPAWQLTDLPVQATFAELDAIPVEADAPAAEPAGPELRAPADIEAAESEPFTDAWGLDIPDAVPAVPAATDDHAASDEAGWAAVHDEPSEDAGATDDDPLAATTATSDADAWLPEDPCPDRDTLPADVGGPFEEEAATPVQSADALPADTESARAAEPVYVPPRPPRRMRRSDWLWATGCVALALALAAQVAWASRVALVRDPATQAQALRVCARLDCRLPPIRDTAKLELLSRDVRPDPAAAGALAITATFRNNAPFRQPWPLVVVELTDLDNNVVAMRRFRPVEYMPDAARRNAGIAAGITAAVAFEVADPGKRAVSFRFGFD
jgi:predicted Zn finger-like uncharacterized protein